MATQTIDECCQDIPAGEYTPQSGSPQLIGGLAFRDWIAAFVIVGSLFMLADWRRNHDGPSRWMWHDQSDHLGAEYDTIAQAVRSGRGFSDPFHEQTGPTAWMPPILVYLTAGLYWLFDDRREEVVEVIVGCNLLTIFFASLLVLRYARSVGLAGVAYLVLAAGLLADFRDLFQRTHDTWLILLVIMLLWLGLQRFADAPRGNSNEAYTWGFCGGAAALCSPVVGAAWAISTVIQWLVLPQWRWEPTQSERSKVFKRGVLSLVAAAAVSVLVVSPWMIRNRIVLGKWIPVKSNSTYEIWQSQVLDDDGVLDETSAYQHPWGKNGLQRKEYVQKGEIEFIGSRGEPTWHSILADPLDFVRRVSRRFVAATLYFQPMTDHAEQMKVTLGFIRSYYPFPLLAFLILVFFGKGPFDRAEIATCCLYVTALLPYILISFYSRYSAPLVMMKMLLILHAVHALRRRFFKYSLFGRHDPVLEAKAADGEPEVATNFNTIRQLSRSCFAVEARVSENVPPVQWRPWGEMVFAPRRSPSRQGFTLIELLLAISIISILISMTLPAVQNAREAARRITCMNHAKQIGLALQMHANTFDYFPGNGGFTPESQIEAVDGTMTYISTRDVAQNTFYQWGIGRPGMTPKKQPGSWAYAILPQLEQVVAYQHVEVEKLQPQFLCPTRGRQRPVPPVDDENGEYVSGGRAWAQTDFCGNRKMMPEYPNAVPLSMVFDGLSHTFVIGEKAYDRGVHGPSSWYWDEPIFSGGSKGTARAGLSIIPDGYDIAFRDNWGSAHPSGAVFAKADGSTNFVTGQVDYKVMRAALTPRGGEVEANELD
ncbi:DUF1559 family PulG-like putative transporter [Roseiconus lacunae]|uniref:DUF1559 family PulG-like putative transporter n=1 Tax=Roseiconus lacunae TaxID=2605694 RepID=UPI001F2BCFF5|nr:DUF1559 domain-containing protein [Roseiconus lacunae]